MSTQEFIVNLIDKAAWPFIALVCLLLMRRPISRLIQQTENLKYKELEILFKKDLDHLSGEVKASLSEREDFPLLELIKKAEENPEETILESWAQVFEISKEIVLKRFPEVSLEIEERYLKIQEVFIEKGVLTKETAKIFHDLRNLRNRVKHAAEFKVRTKEAVQYAALCNAIHLHLSKQGLKNKLSQ